MLFFKTADEAQKTAKKTEIWVAASTFRFFFSSVLKKKIFTDNLRDKIFDAVNLSNISTWTLQRSGSFN